MQIEGAKECLADDIYNLYLLKNNTLECVDLTDLCTGPIYTFYKADLPKSYLDHCIISQLGVQHVNKCYI